MNNHKSKPVSPIREAFIEFFENADLSNCPESTKQMIAEHIRNLKIENYNTYRVFAAIQRSYTGSVLNSFDAQRMTLVSIRQTNTHSRD
jgi:hypothetical protein